MDLTLSIDDDVVIAARKHAESMGTTLDELVQKYLERWAYEPDPKEVAAEIIRLSLLSKENSQGWKRNREDATFALAVRIC